VPRLTAPAEQTYPGERLGLPKDGAGSIAGWPLRITSLVLDWALSTGIAVLVFGTGVLTGHDWRSFMTLAVFFVVVTVMTALTGSSPGQWLVRVAVVRLDRRRLGWWRAALRALMLCLVIPAVVLDENRRGLHDLICRTAVLTRR